MNLPGLAQRATRRPPAVRELRDALLFWFADRAAPRIARGPVAADTAEARRLALLRGRSFFERLASTFEAPTRADLRRVHGRMQAWLESAPDDPDRRLWGALL